MKTNNNNMNNNLQNNKNYKLKYKNNKIFILINRIVIIIYGRIYNGMQNIIINNINYIDKDNNNNKNNSKYNININNNSNKLKMINNRNQMQQYPLINNLKNN